MPENALSTRNQLINALLKTVHRDLASYTESGLAAAKSDPELLGHFCAWNDKAGRIRDAKMAYPVLALRSLSSDDKDLAENAIACLLRLSPRDLVKAYDYNKSLSAKSLVIHGGWRRLLENGLRQYIKVREDSPGWWTATAIQHRKSLKQLYRLSHLKPSETAQKVLFDREFATGSVWADIAGLKKMPPNEQASVILKRKLPFEVIVGSADVKNQSVLLAIVEGMTGNQLITNTKMLERLGVMNDGILRAAYDAALVRAKSDKKVETLKAGRAAAEITDKGLKGKLERLQETKTAALGNIEGDWLVLGDRSGSMAKSVEMAKQIAALIAERVKGAVHLVFFNIDPVHFDVTGKSYAEIQKMTARVNAAGGTSIGCGLNFILEKGLTVQGIAIASDGGENTAPYFSDVYKKYAEKFGVEPTTYFYHLDGESDRLANSCKTAKIEVERFEADKLDYYSLPQLVNLMRVNRYSFYEEIMECPLLTFADALKSRN